MYYSIGDYNDASYIDAFTKRYITLHCLGGYEFIDQHVLYYEREVISMG